VKQLKITTSEKTEYFYRNIISTGILLFNEQILNSKATFVFR